MKKVKIYNSLQNIYQTLELNIDCIIVSLPFGLSYRRFLLDNGLSLNQSFYNNGLLREVFSNKYLYS
jgi:hypothetical protein